MWGERELLSILSGSAHHRRLLILSYHRVLAHSDPLLPSEPSAADFERQLSLVSRYLSVLPLPEAVTRLRDGRLPPRAACVTFDDGYRNNYEVARPLLDRFSLPATFFIATGMVDSGAMWNDLVIESVRRAGATLDLTGYDDLTVRGADAGGIAQVAAVLDAMKYLPLARRAAIAEELYRTYVGETKLSLAMTPTMVRSLADDGHDVGAHTVSHPILAELAPDQARREIEDSRRRVAEITGREPASFAYPNGRLMIDFTAAHQNMVRAAGFQCAVSTDWGCASPRSDRYSLPRLTPWETTPRGFFTRLAKSYVRSYQPTRAVS